MDFREFKTKMQKSIEEILNDKNVLFFVDVDKDELWNLYLDSFPPGTNEIFRERREHDCSCCRNFIKNFGNVVAIDDNYKIITIWDFNTNDSKYQPVISTLSDFIKSKIIKDVFITKNPKIGTDVNREYLEDGTVKKWEHFYYELPKRFVYKSSKSIGELTGYYRDIKNVFKRSLEEINQESIETVLELISQKSLYKGEEWEKTLNKFLHYHKQYSKLENDKKENYCWINSIEAGGVIGKIRNHSIGVLLSDISDGVDLNEAVKRYENIVAPSNYKRPKAIFTKKMVENAQQKVEELGLIDSLGRRFATVNDITINNILFANKDTQNKMEGNVFDEMKKDVPINSKKFDKIEEVSIEHFVEHILPKISNIEVLLENKHTSNLVSLIAPKNKDSNYLFKWNNNFSWAYNGNITDSMKERVKKLGGNISGILRFSIQWNENNDNESDLDAHCVEPSGNVIFFGNKVNHQTSGYLDVDIINPNRKVAVENITWTDEKKMKEGIYRFLVHNYTNRNGKSGFSAEIEYDNQIYHFEYGNPLRNNEKVGVAEIKFDKRKGIEFVKSLPSTESTKTVWNLQTNQFHPVNVCMFSPNYWDEQKGIGNKHYFFMLKDCINDTQPNGFFNEFLKEDLMEHKKVFEALGSKMKVEPSDEQLSGLGFSSTKRNSLVCKVEGNITRTLKINF